MFGLKGKQNEVVIATKFAAYPWRLTSGQFVNACRSLVLSLSTSGLLEIDDKWTFFSCIRASLDRLQIDQLGIGQLHWSTANYAPLQERALWDGLVAMYEKVAYQIY